MACTTKVNQENIRIEPVYVEWSRQQLIKVMVVSSIASNDYFSITDADGVLYHVWYNINSTGVDPAPANSTGIEVTLAAAPTIAQIMTATIAAINSEAAFHAKEVPNCDDEFYIQNKDVGPATAPADGPGGNATGFTITVLRTGEKFDLGYLSGDIEPGTAEDLLDVTTHQTGTQIIQALRTGRNIENISIPMKESSVAKMQEIISAGGGSVTPSEMGATAVYGYGSEDAKAFSAISSDCRKLIFHPVRLAENNLAEDICYFMAYPILTSITFSGESEKLINVEFKILPDGIINKSVRLFAYGDHTQNLLA